MIQFKMKDFFFDRQKVIDRIGKAKARFFIRYAGKIRTIARRSMRRVKDRKRYSAPGNPPFAKSGLLRDRLFFALDKSADSVVIGPEGFKKAEVPALHEYGGTVTRRRRGQSIPVAYPPRPYMGPAYEQVEPDIPKYWQDSV